MNPFHIYQVFSNQSLHYKGNTAAVVLLKKPLPVEQMQSIANDLNQPATSFIWKRNLHYSIRWFAPDAEIGLCGHGAFAALAFLKDQQLTPNITYLTYPSGELTGNLFGSSISMALDAIPAKRGVEVPKAIQEGLNIPILDFLETTNKHIILTDAESTVRDMVPDFSRLRESKIFGYAVTAPGDQADFVSRTLVPHVQQLEDHATGSSHAMLFPFWSQKLGKSEMEARQLSPRGGYFKGKLVDQQVILSGSYELLARGEII